MNEEQIYIDFEAYECVAELKNRPNFLDYSLAPAISEGFVCMKYPDNPRHPHQRYFLTVK